MDTDLIRHPAGPPESASTESDLPVALLAVAVTTAVIAVPYWASSYASVRDDGIFGSFFLVQGALVAGTVVACSLTRSRIWLVLGAMFACTPIAVLGRVLVDTAADPTSHNLWPLEVILAVIISVPPIGVGALIAWPIRRARRPTPMYPPLP